MIYKTTFETWKKYLNSSLLLSILCRIVKTSDVSQAYFNGKRLLLLKGGSCCEDDMYVDVPQLIVG